MYPTEAKSLLFSCIETIAGYLQNISDMDEVEREAAIMEMHTEYVNMYRMILIINCISARVLALLHYTEAG